jgi:hypothetical protein
MTMNTCSARSCLRPTFKNKNKFCMAIYYSSLGIIRLISVQLHNVKSHNGIVTKRLLFNVYVPKRIITKRSCHRMIAVIKRQTSQKVNITKRQMFQNITSQNKNRHKITKNVKPNLTIDMIRQTQQNNTWISWACALT